MAKARTPRPAWIEQGLRVLAEGGPDAVRVEALAQQLGVTKGGFYGYFADRSALLEEMLDTWEQAVTDSIIQEVEDTSRGADARTKLRRLFAIVDVADADPATSFRVELAIREWARRDTAVGDRVRRVDHRQLAYLRSLFGQFCGDAVEIEARCFVAMSVRIGDHLLPVGDDVRSRADATEHVLRQLLA